MAALPLTEHPREIYKLTGQRFKYRLLWEKAISGEIRIAKVGSRYFGDPQEVAEDLGLTVRAAPQSNAPNHEASTHTAATVPANRSATVP